MVPGAIAGFDWDERNRENCQRHGVSITEIEALFRRPHNISVDVQHSLPEERLRAIGKAVFLVFTLREREGKIYLRPISARYMHRREVRHYEEENPDHS